MLKFRSTVLAALLVWVTGVIEAGETVCKIDFGPPESREQGYISLTEELSDTRFLWTGRSLRVIDRGGDDRVNRDFMVGREGEFLLGLDDDDYEVEVAFGDPNYAQGPFNVYAQGELVVERLKTQRGGLVTRTFAARVTEQRLRLKFVAVDGAPFFAVTSVIVRGKQQLQDHRVWPEAPKESIPTPTELEAAGEPNPRGALEACCEWLLDNRREDGFLCQNSTEWYRASYPIRTLLAGYDIFGKTEYLDAVTVCLDKLLGEQLPNAAWSSGYSGIPVSERSETQIQKAMDGTTNTADVGCISSCLAIAYPYVDDDRQKAYSAALKRYADEYAIRWQLPSGGFTNGRWSGKDMTTPYSVAAGTQGMSFCGLYVISGERKYLEIAQRAVEFLLDNWQEDGRPIHHHHAQDTTQVLDLTDAGDMGSVFYYYEALLWVWNWTDDEALKERIGRVCAWHVEGEKGLLRAREHEVWWPLGHPWGNAKQGGMPLIIFEHDRHTRDNTEVREAARRCAVFLSHADFAKRIGVRCDPGMPWGRHSMQATGFAGLSLAELVEPGVTFLKSEKAALGK